MNKKVTLLAIFIIVIAEFIFLGWMKHSYNTTMAEGKVFEVPATINFSGDFYNRNYILVYIPFFQTKLEGDKNLKEGEEIYVSVYTDRDGLMKLDHAQSSEPATGDYFIARVNYIDKGTVNFKFPVDRMYVTKDDLKKYSIVELSEKVQVKEKKGEDSVTKKKNEVTAQIRIKDGHVVIEKILASGASADKVFTTKGKNLKIKYSDGQTTKDIIEGQELSEEITNKG